MSAEARGLVRLIARDRGTRHPGAVRLLEDHAQPLEGLSRLAPDPTRRADLLEAVDQSGRLAVGGELHSRGVRALAREVVDADGAVAPPAAHAQLLDDLAGAVGLRD